MAKKKKSKKSLNTVRNLLIRLLLIGMVAGAFYVFKNKPEVLGTATQEASSDQEDILKKATSLISTDKIAQILGNTTALVAEGLETIKVPKNLSGMDEEVVIQDIVDDFTQKVKNLPDEQVDRMKVQFCADLLSGVENVSIVEDE